MLWAQSCGLPPWRLAGGTPLGWFFRWQAWASVPRATGGGRVEADVDLGLLEGL